MNSMNDSGDFQDVESKFCGGLSHVSSQPLMIPSSRALLSRDKRLPLDTWNQSGLQENVFGNQFLRLIHPEIILKDFNLTTCTNREAAPEAERTKTIYTSEDRLNQGPMPTFATRPLTTSSAMPVDLPQNYIVGQQRQQISDLQFDKLPNLQSFWCGKYAQVTTCFDFPSDATLWIKEVEMVVSLDDLEILAISLWKGFSKLRDAGRDDCLCSEQDHQNSQFKKQVSLEEQKAQTDDRFLRGRQIAFMIYDHFRVTGAHDTVLYYADLFSVTLREDNVQEFDTRWDEVLLSMSKKSIRSYLGKSVQIEEYVSLINSNSYLNCTTWRFIRRHRFLTIKSWKPWSRGLYIDQKLRLRNFDARHGKIESGAVIKSRKGIIGVEGGKGIC